MSEDRNRIRIVVGDRELELDGTQAFMAFYEETLTSLLEALRSAQTERRDPGKKSSKPLGGVLQLTDGEFGEQLGALPKAATGTDQMLLGGCFAQLASADNSFATGEASALLLEQSIKIGNPSQCMANNLNAKRVFKVGPRYRVSKAGEEYLIGMMTS